MAKVHQELVEILLESTNAQKEEIGNQLVISLGGNPQKKVTNLPRRRGNSDGGIDGRIPIIIETISSIQRHNEGGIPGYLYTQAITETKVEAAFCIKMERSTFTRDQLNAFVGDMQREKIFDGIIISARPLATDALYQMNEYNQKGSVKICHLILEDILTGNIKCDFKFTTEKPLNEILIENVKSFLN